MGRAIVREPSVFLMDEPLSNLDAKLRVQMRAEVARIQRRLGVATLYVTHDQVEAMTMGDRVAVLRAGVLQQCDKPQTLYDNPANLFVAGVHGLPGDEPLRGRRSAKERASVLIGSQTIELPDDAPCRETRRCADTPVGRWWSGSGPRTSRSSGPTMPRPTRARVFEGNVELVEALGSELLVHFTTDAHQVEVADTKHEDAEGLTEGALVKGGEGVARVDARAKSPTESRARFQTRPATGSTSSTPRRARPSSTDPPPQPLEQPPQTCLFGRSVMVGAHPAAP